MLICNHNNEFKICKYCDHAKAHEFKSGCLEWDSCGEIHGKVVKVWCEVVKNEKT